jgi:tRNA pseudouridine38-40 synthase
VDAEVGPTIRLRLVVAYLGASFRGFALQPGQVTVAGVLSAALQRHLRHPVELTCAGRTDAGVHAWGQVVTFDARSDVDPLALQRSVNKTLHPTVVIRQVQAVDATFDARRSATGRRYYYRVLNTPVADPFQATTAWHVATPLDLRAMRLACDPLYGEHDFSSFCRRPRPARTAEATGPAPEISLVRGVRRADWTPLGDGLLRFEIEASSFCHQMVRSVVGTMVQIGLGRRRAGEMSAILAAGDRALAGPPAPPHGLCLWEVSYPG